MDFKSDLIYPEINVKEKNTTLATNLLEIFTGRNSIINNILLYLYQASFLEEKYSSILKNIIDVEINHAKIMSRLINELGFKPRFTYKSFNGYKYYNASYINYEINKEKIFQNNFEDKSNLINKMNDLIETIEDNNVKEIINRLVIDYKIHIKIFNDLLTTEKK